MIEPNILFEDEDILVIEKPAGMIVNRSDTTAGHVTVQDWAGLLSGKGGGKGARPQGKPTGAVESEFYKRGGVVHRLDKETSGILILAKNQESFENLQKQFKEGRVKKTYIALCHGEIKPLEGQINIPIGRLPWNRMRFGVLPQGRQAKTRYRVISNFQFPISNSESKGLREDKTLSLIEAYPESGRTHQIRVHAKHIGHPIFSDELYAGRKVSKRDRKLLPRHFLHASKIKFEHPKTGQTMEVKSPLPSDLQEFLNELT